MVFKRLEAATFDIKNVKDFIPKAFGFHVFTYFIFHSLIKARNFISFQLKALEDNFYDSKELFIKAFSDFNDETK